MNPEEFVRSVSLPFAMVVASKRNSGKTQLVSQLIDQFVRQGKVWLPVVYSATAHLNDDYKFLPKRLVRPFDPAHLRDLMKRQADTPKEQRKPMLLVLDDLLSDNRATGNQDILYAYAMGRHINIHPILISQQANKILTPTVRNNADYFLLSRLNRQQLGEVWESICFLEKGEFIRFVELANKDYTFVAIDNTSNSNQPEDVLKLVRADATTLPRHKDWEQENLPGK